MWAVDIVIPRFRSSGALSMAPYSKNLAYPFSACRLVIAAVKVVYEWLFSEAPMPLELKGLTFP